MEQKKKRKMKKKIWKSTDIIQHVERIKKKSPETNYCSKITAYMVNIQTSISFPYSSNNPEEFEIKITVSYLLTHPTLKNEMPR